MPIIIPEFITTDEQAELIAWEEQVRENLTINGTNSGCFFQTIDRLPIVPDVFHTVRLRVQARVGTRDDQKEHDYGWYLSSTATGDYIKEHMDGAPPGMFHLRCNLFVQAPVSGGVPVIEGQPYPIESRTLLGFFPSVLKHSCTPVEGPHRRIVCSYGYVVDAEHYRYLS